MTAAPATYSCRALDVLVGDVIWETPNWLRPEGASYTVAKATYQFGDLIESTGLHERMIRFDFIGGGSLVVGQTETVAVVEDDS